MKIIKFTFYFFLSFSISILTVQSADAAQQSNFQIAPSPITYPYFNEGRFDGQIGATFVSIAMPDFSMMGGDLGGKFRSAFNDFIAIDGTAGITFLGGTMQPGIVPISYHDNLTYPGSEATLSLAGMRCSINLELQPVHTSEFDIILFGGPQFSFTNFTITSDYFIWTGTSWKSGYEDKLTILSTMSGAQFGIQLNINLGSDIMLSPFFMMTSSSGNATMTDDPQLSGYSPASYSFDIPSTTSVSYGMDIIFGDISIGSVLQQMKKTEETTQDTRIIMISISSHFSSGGETSDGSTDGDINYNTEENKDL